MLQRTPVGKGPSGKGGGWGQHERRPWLYLLDICALLGCLGGGWDGVFALFGLVCRDRVSLGSSRSVD